MSGPKHRRNPGEANTPHSSPTISPPGSFPLQEPRRDSLPPVSVARKGLASDDLTERRTVARSIKNSAEKERDISKFFHVLIRGLRTEEDPFTKIYYLEAAKFAARSATNPERLRSLEALLPALATCMGSADQQMRYNSILFFAHFAENGGNIRDYVSALAGRLSDLSPMNREASLKSLKAFASQGQLEATKVLEAALPVRIESADRADLSDHCLSVITQSDSSASLEEHVAIIRTSVIPAKVAASFFILKRLIGENVETARDVLTLLGREIKDIPYHTELRNFCLKVMRIELGAEYGEHSDDDSS